MTGVDSGRAAVGFEMPADTPVYVISVAAQLSGLHPQTLRQYDRLGLVCPGRTGGGGRRYSPRDIEQLREVQRLSQDEGVNLAGIKRIIELDDTVAALRTRLGEVLAELNHLRGELDGVDRTHRRTYLPARVESSRALVAWRPPPRR